MPKLTEDFKVVPPGKIYPEVIPKGTEVDGELADIAKSCGKIKGAPKTKAAKPPENK
jgi:hypothetical protein